MKKVQEINIILIETIQCLPYGLNLHNMAQLRQEIYDENGLVEVIYHEVEEPSQEELIAQKEAELLAMYAELQALKGE